MKGERIRIACLRIVCFLITILCVSGCGKQSEEKKEPLTILTTHINYEKFVEALDEKYPGIELEFVSYRGFNQTGYIRECLEDGELPDIVTTTYFVDHKLQSDRLMDLSKYSFVNNYSDSWLNRCSVDGSIYLLPSNYSAIGFYYNKTIMEKYGWELPKNFQEYKILAEKIREKGLKPCVARMDLDGYIFSDFFGLGNTFFFNTPQGEAWKQDFLTGKAKAKGNIEPVLSYLNEWISEGFINEEDINNTETSEQFYRGEAVFMFCNGMNLMKRHFEGIGTMEYGIMPWLAPEGESKMIVSNVSRYYGLNKELEKEENQKKLEDALKVLDFLSTEEGMCLLKDNITTISPLNTSEIKEDNMYYEIKEEIVGGNTIPLVYVGWDDIIIPMAEQLHALIKKETTVEECAEAFDKIRDQWLNSGPFIYGQVEETISQEKTAELVGRALIENKKADVALLSLGGFHGFGQENPQGIQCGIYPGDFTLDRLRTIVPSGKMGIISMTGEEILERKKVGKYIHYNHLKEGEKNDPFPYVMAIKEGIELEEKEEYLVVLSLEDLSKELQKKIRVSWGTKESQLAIEEYILSHPACLLP